MPRIDAHVHVFVKPSERFPREIDAQLPADREAPVERLLDEMDANGIDQAVLVQIGGAEQAHHAYLLHCLASHPSRFCGIGLIPSSLERPEAHMDALMDGTGIIGFRLRTLGGPRDPLGRIDPTEFKTYPIWRVAAERDVVLWLYLNAADVHLLPHLLERFPQVRVVLNHLGICPGKGKVSLDANGRPRIETPRYNPAMHTTWRLAGYENVAVHLSGQYAFTREDYPYRDIAGWARGLIGNFGSKRTMWATDFPWILDDPGYASIVRLPAETMSDLSEETMRDVMGEAARRFLRFPNPA